MAEGAPRDEEAEASGYWRRRTASFGDWAVLGDASGREGAGEAGRKLLEGVSIVIFAFVIVARGVGKT